MKTKLLALTIILIVQKVKSEPWPMTPVFELCMNSNLIVEARLETISDNEYIFSVTEYGKENPVSRELRTSDIKHFFSIDEAIENRKEIEQLRIDLGLKELSMAGYDTVNFDNADRIFMFLYLHEETLKPIYSGMRIVKNNRVYNPMQREIPGNYSFGIDCNADEKEFLENLNQNIKISNKLKEIIYNTSLELVKQRKLLKRWIKEYLVKFEPRLEQFNYCIDWQFGILKFYCDNKEGSSWSRKFKKIKVSEIRNLYKKHF